MKIRHRITECTNLSATAVEGTIQYSIIISVGVERVLYTNKFFVIIFCLIILENERAVCC